MYRLLLSQSRWQRNRRTERPVSKTSFFFLLLLLWILLFLYWRATWWSVAVAEWLSGSRCWLTVHQYQSPSASWSEGVHVVSSNNWVVGATPQWPDSDEVWGLARATCSKKQSSLYWISSSSSSRLVTFFNHNFVNCKVTLILEIKNLRNKIKYKPKWCKLRYIAVMK